jgi:hypothetical protein
LIIPLENPREKVIVSPSGKEDRFSFSNASETKAKSSTTRAAQPHPGERSSVATGAHPKHLLSTFSLLLSRPPAAGKRFHSPGLPRQRLPGVPGQKWSRKPVGLRLTAPCHPLQPAKPDVHPTTPIRRHGNCHTPTSSCAGARFDHPPRPPAAWENGGSTVLQVVSCASHGGVGSDSVFHASKPLAAPF